jgi:SpoVK/Ycf46/Vps4 family AAA+-type ATPase
MKEQMRKKNILNLIKYHAEKNDAGFKKEAYDIARYFDSYNLPFFSKVDLSVNNTLPLPSQIQKDVIGIINSIGHKAGITKFLFEGDPGTGKTETVKQVARILERELYSIDFDTVVDSKLGQTSKNLASVFTELKHLPQPNQAIILFDEIDAIALDRVNPNDLREMGRVTSSMLKGLDGLSDDIILIATTNLYSQFDKALLRRFDMVVNFNRYSNDDLVEVAESILNQFLTKFKSTGRNMRLFRKILLTMERLPYPGDLKNMIKTALAFSDPQSEFDYLKKLYEAVHPEKDALDLKVLQNKGFTVRDIEILTDKSKSQVARDLST